jgi:hypothetical protein
MHDIQLEVLPVAIPAHHVVRLSQRFMLMCECTCMDKQAHIWN